MPQEASESHNDNETKRDNGQVENDLVHSIGRYGASVMIISHWTRDHCLESVLELSEAKEEAEHQDTDSENDLDQGLPHITLTIHCGVPKIIHDLLANLLGFHSIQLFGFSSFQALFDQEFVKFGHPGSCPHVPGQQSLHGDQDESQDQQKMWKIQGQGSKVVDTRPVDMKSEKSGVGFDPTSVEVDITVLVLEQSRQRL